MGINRLDKDRLRLHRIVVQCSLGYPITSASSPAAPPALPPKAAAAIFGELTRYDFSRFTQVQGGAEFSSADGKTALSLTGMGWQFAEDLDGSVITHAVEKMAVAVRHFVDNLPPGVLMVNQITDLVALWDFGGPSTDYIARRFLSQEALRLPATLTDLEFNGGAIRLNFTRPAQTTGPQIAGVNQIEEFDVRIEPYFQDKSKIFLQVVGIFPVPTRAVSEVERRVNEVVDLLLRRVADSIAL
jgi:hypothetical protein